jgi:hypothetical protein
MIEKPKIDEHGFQYYETVPEGFRLANIRDLEKGLFRHNTGYLLHSYHSPVYYPRRVLFMFPKDDIPYLKDGRVWIYVG